MLWISHQGESYDAPGNTMKAFRLAWERDSDGIELDIHLTSDKHVVCIHDADTERVGDKNLVIAEESYEVLSKVDVGQGEKIPLLSQVLAESPPGKLIYIEVKTGSEILPNLVEIINHSNVATEDLRIIDFNNTNLKECKKILPTMKTYLLANIKSNDETNQLYPGVTELLTLASESKIDGFDLRACEKIDKKFLSELDGEIVVWTINELNIANKFISYGVNAITSDRAAYLKNKLKK